MKIGPLTVVLRLPEHVRNRGRRLSGLLLAATLLGTGCGPSQPEPEQRLEPIEIAPSSAFHLLDLADNEVNPFASTDARWLVFIFISVDCPISNRYAPEIRRLHGKFAPQGVRFWLVHPNVDESAAAIRKHTEDYQYQMGVLRDSKHRLVKETKVRVTPEAVVFERTGRMLYRGRIDDRFADLGKERAAPTAHDLENALRAVIAGQPVPQPATRAIGCYIPQE